MQSAPQCHLNRLILDVAHAAVIFHRYAVEVVFCLADETINKMQTIYFLPIKKKKKKRGFSFCLRKGEAFIRLFTALLYHLFLHFSFTGFFFCVLFLMLFCFQQLLLCSQRFIAATLLYLLRREQNFDESPPAEPLISEHIIRHCFTEY